jgi:hypothetical protein
MAESMRGRAEPTSGAAGVDRPIDPATEPERLLPPEAESTQRIPDYDNPDTARRHIEATRARMSGTIDEIEDTLIRKKERLQNRFDMAAPIREKPWAAMGLALGAGLLLGLLTAGEDESDRDDHRDTDPDRDRDWHRRASMLEGRSRRLLRIAREQEEELERLHRARERYRSRRRAAARSEHRHDADDEEQVGAEEHRSRFDELREAILAQVGEYVGRALRQLETRGSR